ncbi:flagellar hook-length control protein FliK [Nitrosomonas sp. Nm51]|uniref:flagellar hook-length control protein FliK n=1 Tax=Nitrosomonas sp. Nm51 TaxID=133720 RepID=UPI0015A58415|nr:flagellar hook-length control protein FliK [Nitrosomonas sp. Nm51]
MIRTNESNETEGKQFDNVLAREVENKKQPAATDRDPGNANSVDAKSAGNTESKENTVNKTDNSDSGNTAKSSSQTKSDLAQESSQENDTAQIELTENNTDNTIIPPLQTVQVPGISPNQSGIHANNTNLGHASVSTSILLQSQSEIQQNDKHRMPTNQYPWQQLSQADNSAGDGKKLPFLSNLSGNNLGNGGLLNNANPVNTARNGSMPQFSIDTMQSLLGNQDWGQLLQAANVTSSSDKISEFSTDAGDFLARLTEASSLLQTDSDTIFQTGLNNLSQTLSQTATHATASQHIDIDAQIGQPKWNGEFTQKIVWLASQQHQFAELRLNPAHLGPVEIMLNLTNDNGTQASAQFVSPHLAVREAIEAALPRLRELMAESGIQLGDVMVGAESFQQQDKAEQQANHPDRNTPVISAHNNSDTSREGGITIGRHNGIVNTFA